MKYKFLGLFAAFVSAGLLQTANADGIFKKHHAAPACEPGYQMVEETTYQNVTRTICKMVPETKKKWVYDWVDDPFCIQDSRRGDCPGCAGPYCRKQLVKRQIDEPCPTMKCVTETITECVPVIVYRKVPCAPAVAMPPVQAAPQKP